MESSSIALMFDSLPQYLVLTQVAVVSDDRGSKQRGLHADPPPISARRALSCSSGICRRSPSISGTCAADICTRRFKVTNADDGSASQPQQPVTALWRGFLNRIIAALVARSFQIDACFSTAPDFITPSAVKSVRGCPVRRQQSVFVNDAAIPALQFHNGTMTLEHYP